VVGQGNLFRFYGVIKMSEVTNKNASILGNKAWYRVKDLSEMLSMSDSTIWKMVKKNSFPKPKHITPRMTVWLRDDILNYIEAKTKELDGNDNQAVTEALVNAKDGADQE